MLLPKIFVRDWMNLQNFPRCELGGGHENARGIKFDNVHVSIINPPPPQIFFFGLGQKRGGGQLSHLSISDVLIV